MSFTKKTPEQWDLIRREYESTDISIDALSRKYGLASGTSVRRRIASNSWTRNPEAIAVYITTREIAGTTPENAPFRVSTATKKVRKTASAHILFSEQSEDMPPSPYTEEASGPVADATRAPPTIYQSGKRAPAPVGVEVGERELQTAGGLARQNIDVIRQQITSGDTIEQTGLDVLIKIQQYLTAEPESDVMTQAVRRLIGVNPDRETLAQLMMAATSLVKAGTAMKRQALAMDVVVKGADGALAGGAVVPIKGAGARLLQHMSPEAMKAMRVAALEASRLSPGKLAAIDVDPS